MDENASRPVSVRLVGVEDLPILLANQFILQVHDDGYLLICGQVAPPLVLGGKEEQRHQLEQIFEVPGKPLVRLALTRQRLVQLGQLIGGVLQGSEQPEIGS